MKFKELAVEFFQATAFTGLLAFGLGLLGQNDTDFIIEAALGGFLYGGIPMMLARRFCFPVLNKSQNSD